MRAQQTQGNKAHRNPPPEGLDVVQVMERVARGVQSLHHRQEEVTTTARTVALEICPV